MYLAKVDDLMNIGKNSNNSGRTMNDNINICVSDTSKYVNIDDLFDLCENDRYNMYQLGRTARRYIRDEAKEYKEVTHAHWYKDKITKLYKCSNCHKYATYGFANARVWKQCISKYCPFCNATMDEKEN